MSTDSIEPRVELACLDMAGTTIVDDGAVESAFLYALDELGVEKGSDERTQMLTYVRETMGTSKIVVFRALFGDEVRAQKANAAFEAAYADEVVAGRIVPVPGAVEVISQLRKAGVKVALATGFSAQTQQLLIASLDWHDLIDLAVCPSETLRGRPYPDMVLQAIITLGVTSTADVAVVGDTILDIETGRRAGASVVTGVLTGAGRRSELFGAGASHVIDSVASLCDVLLPH